MNGIQFTQFNLKVIEVIEPGLSQRRGLSLFERAVCHLQVKVDTLQELTTHEQMIISDFLKHLLIRVCALSFCVRLDSLI